MLLLCAVWLLLPNVNSYVVKDSTEDIPNNNITTLYPVTYTGNNTGPKTHPEDNQKTETENKDTKIKSEATGWKIETAFSESKLPEKEEESEKKIAETKEDSNGMDSKEEAVLERPENHTKDFKPSQPLGDYFDLDDVLPPQKEDGGFSPFTKKPYSSFHGSPQKYPHNLPSPFPYKFDLTPSKPRDEWKPSQESGKFGKLPARGLYQHPDPFKDKPGTHEEEAGLDFSSGDYKETSVRKRPDPWRRVVQLLTALIPVGLIVSALTPAVITVEDSSAGRPGYIYPNRFVRRAVFPVTPASPASTASPTSPATPGTPPITERCRRRLLCELYSDKHYNLSSPDHSQLSPGCARLRCSDPQTLVKMLTWIFKQPGDRRNSLT